MTFWHQDIPCDKTFPASSCPAL